MHYVQLNAGFELLSRKMIIFSLLHWQVWLHAEVLSWCHWNWHFANVFVVCWCMIGYLLILDVSLRYAWWSTQGCNSGTVCLGRNPLMEDQVVLMMSSNVWRFCCWCLDIRPKGGKDSRMWILGFKSLVCNSKLQLWNFSFAESKGSRWLKIVLSMMVCGDVE